jgi:hypothetical protein
MILIDSVGVEVLARVSAWTRRKGGDLVLRRPARITPSSWTWPAAPKPPASSRNWEPTDTAA